MDEKSIAFSIVSVNAWMTLGIFLLVFEVSFMLISIRRKRVNIWSVHGTIIIWMEWWSIVDHINVIIFNRTNIIDSSETCTGVLSFGL
ncbi:hypothetical protein ACJX0J_013451, partial [Zea mays]